MFSLFFFFNDTATTEIYTLSLHDALPICLHRRRPAVRKAAMGGEHQRHREPDQGPEDVRGVSADQRVEGGAVGAGRDRQPEADRACPLVARDQQEERAEASRGGEPLHQTALLAARERTDGARHYDARGEEHERVDAGDAHGEPRLVRRRPEGLTEPRDEERRDQRGKEHHLAADQEEDGQLYIVEHGSLRRRLAVRPVAAARRRGWWPDGPVRPVRDRPALGRRLEEPPPHPRIPTRDGATTSAAMIMSRTRRVWRAVVAGCARPGRSAGGLD